jgi:hypothetical protein
MAAIDREADAASAADREHLSGCSSCQQWLTDLQRMDTRLQSLAYPDAPIDLWTSLQSQIRQGDATPDATRRLWVLGALVLAWRVLQLWIDLPLPALHPLVPFAAVAVALWLLAGDSLAVRTFAPELQKRGI